MSKSEAVEAWLKFHRKGAVDVSAIQKVPKPDGFHRPIYDRLSQEVRLRSRTGGLVRIWSAGSGNDFISLKLKSDWKTLIDLTISDISPECIEFNRQLFTNFGLEADFVVGDLFDSDYVEEFDIVTNTGLLEHFSRAEQEELLRRFSRSLKPGGVYLTLVPYSGARIYRLLMDRFKRKGIWMYGPEEPVSNLRYLETDEISLIEESQVAPINQLAMMTAVFPIAGRILGVAVTGISAFGKIAEPILIKTIGGYCLFGKFEKKRGV